MGHSNFVESQRPGKVGWQWKKGMLPYLLTDIPSTQKRAMPAEGSSALTRVEAPCSVATGSLDRMDPAPCVLLSS